MVYGVLALPVRLGCTFRTFVPVPKRSPSIGVPYWYKCAFRFVVFAFFAYPAAHQHKAHSLCVSHCDVVDGVIAFFRNSVDATENRVGSPLFEAVPLAFASDAVGGHCEAYENFKHIEPRFVWV